MSYEIIWEADDMPDLDEDTLRAIIRGRFTEGGRVYYRLRAAQFYAAIAGTLPGYGRRSAEAQTRGVYASFSTERWRGGERRFPVMRLAIGRWTVVDVDAQEGFGTTPDHVLAYVPSGRGYLVVSRLPWRKTRGTAFVAQSDPRYIAGSIARRFWHIRSLDKMGAQRPRRLILTGNGNRDERRALASAWRAAGGEVQGNED